MRPFKSLEQQIQILRERGLAFDNEEEAKLYLLDNNYYNIINMFSKVFQENTNQYVSGTEFKEIKALHILDTEIKANLMKFILVAEKHFKSILSYYLAEEYHDEPYAYLRTSSYPDTSPLEISRTLSDISRKISSLIQKKEPNSVKHHHGNYHDVPLWVIINELEFGTVRYMYKHSSSRVRTKVARRLAQFLYSNTKESVQLPPEYIDRMLEHINEIRNCVAHNNKLHHFTCRKHLYHVAVLFEPYGVLKDSPKNTVFSTFLTLQCFMPDKDYRIFYNTLLKRFKVQSKNISTIPFSKVLECYSFPDGWHLSEKRAQQTKE